MEKPTNITEEEISKIIDTAAIVGFDDRIGKEVMGNMVRGQFRGTNEEFINRIKEIKGDLDKRKSPVEGFKNSYAEAIRMILEKVENKESKSE